MAWPADKYLEEEDGPQSAAEAAADDEAARMNLLLDRVQARLNREGWDAEAFDRVYEEERERLRKERGEPEPEPLTEEEEAERAARIEELNRMASWALEEYEAKLAAGKVARPERHPLVVRCTSVHSRLRREAEKNRWIAEDTPQEHPLMEVIEGSMLATAKLAGALVMHEVDGEWPPDRLFAGSTLARLKKARGHLTDALRGLDAADEEGLATARWRKKARTEITGVLEEVKRLIAEVREVLRDGEDGGEGPLTWR